MLVLSRKEEEEIYAIDLSDLSASPIITRIVDIKRSKVRVVIDASDRYAIYRPEVIKENMPEIWSTLVAGRPLTSEMVTRLSLNSSYVGA